MLNIPLPENPLLPDAKGFFGEYGGQFSPEILYPNLQELTLAFNNIIGDKNFWQAYQAELQEYAGRPSPITYLANVSEYFSGAKIYLKREDLNHTGAHKINNVIGQGMLVKRLGKTRVIAETGAGQHGVATATMAARLKLAACIYMGAEDVARQRPNVFWMQRMGAQVIAVEDGSKTLKDAINAALRDWARNLADTHYVLGTVCGPHPFPAMVAYFQSIIGLEARQQMLKKINCLPDKVYACVGGGSNAIGIFQGFLHDKVDLIGVEAGGKSDKPGEHASRIASHQAQVGIAQGNKTYLLQDSDGQLIDTHSVAAGLDYVGVSPIFADLADKKRVRFEKAMDHEVVDALKLLIRLEGIIPAMESAHALAQAFKEAPHLRPDQHILISLSGRGDKDIFTIARAFADDTWLAFLKQEAEVLSR